jgi:hypothetical protein
VCAMSAFGNSAVPITAGHVRSLGRSGQTSPAPIGRRQGSRNVPCRERRIGPPTYLTRPAIRRSNRAWRCTPLLGPKTSAAESAPLNADQTHRSRSRSDRPPVKPHAWPDGGFNR